MPLEVNRPGDSGGEKPRLSAFGRRVVAVAVILVLLATALIYSRIQANNRKAELAEQVLAAVERSKIVCTNGLSAVGAGSEAQAALQGFIKRIGDARQVAAKAAVAQEMITYCLSQVQGDRSQVDELTGARNRIIVALQEYESGR